jgi:hypothetical protein
MYLNIVYIYMHNNESLPHSHASCRLAAAFVVSPRLIRLEGVDEWKSNLGGARSWIGSGICDVKAASQTGKSQLVLEINIM